MNRKSKLRPGCWPRHPSVIAGAAVASLVPSGALADPPSVLYGLAWEETFAGTAVDTSRWYFRTDTRTFSSITSKQIAANATIDSGQLSLLMTVDPSGANKYFGSGVVSKQQFGYGYFEVRARGTNNTGWHNSFWMMAGDGSNTSSAGRFLEIDSSEVDTANQMRFHSGLHYWNGAGSSELGNYNCSTYPTATNLTSAYHTYGADWREGFVDFYFDGQKYCTAPYSTTSYRQDPVNIWLTAVAYSLPVSVGGSPQLFDTVRFYKRDQYVTNGRYGYSESGTGWLDSGVAGFGLMPQRYSCTAGAKSTYAPGFNQSGNYRVFIWKTVQANADTQSEVKVQSNTGTTTSTINFTTGSSGWIDLGVHAFSAGGTNPAYGVTNTVHSGCQRAGAVKFVREV